MMIDLTTIPASLIEHTGWVLLHSVWQFAAIAVLVLIGNRMLRNTSASVRYVLLLSGLIVLTAAPLVTWYVLPNPAEEMPVAVVVPESIPVLDNVSSAEPDIAAMPALPTYAPPIVEPAAPIDLSVPTADESSVGNQPAAPWHEVLAELLEPWLSTIVVLWCGGVLLFSLRPMVSWLNVRRLRTTGTSAVSDSIQALVQSVGERLQVRRRVHVLASTIVTSPVVVGCFRSVILLPTAFIAQVPPSQLEAILAHELAHVRRYDYLANLLQTLVETLFFYHPAVWWLSHRIREERENCCDDLVVATFQNKTDYGRALLAVEEFRSIASRSSALVVSAKGGSLLARIRRLLDSPRDDDRRSISPIVLTLTALVLCSAAANAWLFNDAEEQNDKTSILPPDSYVAELPGGRSIELVGMTMNNQPVSEGWKPDGRQLDESVGEWYPDVLLDGDARDFLFRITGVRERPTLRFTLPGREAHFTQWSDQNPWHLRVCGSVAKPEFAGPSGVVQVAFTDEPWGQWVQVDAESGTVSNPPVSGDRYFSAYKQVSVTGVSNVPNDTTGESPGLILTAPMAYNKLYDIECRVTDSAEVEATPPSSLGWEKEPTNGFRNLKYRILSRLAEDHKWRRFEFRLRPFRYLVTFENVVTEGQSRQPTDVKVSVDTIPDLPPDTYKADLPDGRSVELVGITKNTRPASEGWKPDGRRLDDSVGEWPKGSALYGNTIGGALPEGVQPHEDARDFLFRFTGLKAQPSLNYELPTRSLGALNSPLQQPYLLRVSGRLRDKASPVINDAPEGVVRVAVTDEPWGKWLQVSATDASILNPFATDDLYRSVYETVKIQGLKPPEEGRTSGTPLLVIHHPLKHRQMYAFEIRGIDSNGDTHHVDHLTTSAREEESIDIHEYGLFRPDPLREGVTLERFEFRLRPYRYLVTFENVVTEVANNPPSKVKVNVQTINHDGVVSDARQPGGTDAVSVTGTKVTAPTSLSTPNAGVPARECVTLQGVCRDENGKALQRVWIRVYGGRVGAGRLDRTAEIIGGVTDEDGRFHLTAKMPLFLQNLAIDSVGFVAVFSRDRGRSVVMRSWSGQAVEDNLEVRLSGRPFTLRGLVVDTNGKPVQGASLFLRDNILNAALPGSHNGLTDVEGRFEIPGLQSSENAKGFLDVYHAAYGQKQVIYEHQQLSLRKSDDLKITLDDPGVLFGTVIDSATGQPQANCIVTARTTRNAGLGQGVTDSAGDYKLRVPPGDYVVTIGGRPPSGEQPAATKTYSVKSGQTTEVLPLTLDGANLRNELVNNATDFPQSAPDNPSAKLNTPKQPSSKASVSRHSKQKVAERVTSLLAKLKQQQDERLSGKDEWARTMKALIELGPDAVPALSAALDQTAQDDRSMLRSIPFVLRGIGDRRAVPALIRAIPKCFGADGSDMGYRCEDPDLLRYMQVHDTYDQHDPSRGPEDDYSYGRPVNEVFRTLEKWTGHRDRLRQLYFVDISRSDNSPGNTLGQRLYNQAALEWQSFWETNWAKHTSDKQFAKVGVELVREPERLPPVSRDVSLSSNSGEGNGSLSSVLSATGERWEWCFRDLDTGLSGELPERFLKLSREERIARMDEIVAEAQKVGFDLMGTEEIQDGKPIFVLQPIGMEIWEISKDAYDGTDSIETISANGRPAENVIAHYDDATKAYDLPAASYFFVVTQEGTPMKMLLGVPITSIGFIGGPSDHTGHEFRHTGMRLGRRYALRFLKPVEGKAKTDQPELPVPRGGLKLSHSIFREDEQVPRKSQTLQNPPAKSNPSIDSTTDDNFESSAPNESNLQTSSIDHTSVDGSELLQVFAQQLRAVTPVKWTVEQKERAFRLLGPEPKDNDERARILLWFDDVSISSSDLDKRDKSDMDIGHLDNTQLGRLYITRNKAAVKLWGHAYTEIRAIQPVEHIAFADLDNLRNIAWFDAAYVRDVSIDASGRPQRLLGRFSATETGITADTKFLVVGRTPEVAKASTDAEREIAQRFAANLNLLKAAAQKRGVTTISLTDFEAYTKRRLQEGRGFPTKWVKDPNRIQPPECLLTGEGLQLVPPGDAGEVSLNKKPTAKLPWRAFGRVVDGDGKPLPGVTVRAATGYGTLRGGASGVTDADGRYDFRFGMGIMFGDITDVVNGGKPHPQTQYALISARLDGHFESNFSRQGNGIASLEPVADEGLKHWNVAADQVCLPDQPREINFVMLPAAKVSGTLIGEDNQPLKDYSVSLTGKELPPGSSVLAQVYTDENGRFEITEIPTTVAYQFVVRKPRAELKPPWNDSWASGPMKFVDPAKDDFSIRSEDEATALFPGVRVRRFQLKISGPGVHGKTAIANSRSRSVADNIQLRNSTDRSLQADKLTLTLSNDGPQQPQTTVD